MIVVNASKGHWISKSVTIHLHMKEGKYQFYRQAHGLTVRLQLVYFQI